MNRNDEIISLASTDEFQHLLEKCAKLRNLLLVDFYADWCGPCRTIAPQFHELAREFSSRYVIFAKVNADLCQELCQQEFVSALPTFKLYNNKECVVTVVGARMEQLRSAIEKYALDPSILQIMSAADSETKNSALQYLIRMFKNVVSGSVTVDNRCLNLGDGDFQNCLLNVPGAMECLFAAGFQEADDCLLLPPDADIGRIKILLEHLIRLCNEPDAKPEKEVISVRDSVKQLEPVLNISQGANRDHWHEFRLRLLEPIKTVSGYLEPEARNLARSLIPTEELIDAAAMRSGCKPDAITPRAFLRELLRWYKEDFFRWADSFKCAQCQSAMKFHGTAAPTPQESLGRPGVVELYQCPSEPNHPVYRFPRYNDVKTLLRTRLGRCGEWANCLTLILSSCSRSSKSHDSSATAGEAVPWFQACRYVVDWTDHVWCEVWLEDEQNPGAFRWVHCDPGGEVDQPLLYEQGWGKKLTYVFAYTVPPISLTSPSVRWDADEMIQMVDIQDVTWRYTRNFQEVCTRRHQAMEPRLAAELTARHLSACSLWPRVLNTVLSPKHPFSLSHIACELASFLTQPKLPSERLPGRQTGSLEWRKARGELGAEDPALLPIWRGSNIPLRPTPEELKKGTFFIRYNAALDIYQRPCSCEADPSPPQTRSNIPRDTEAMISEAKRLGLKGWQSLATRWRNISRKVERDWHMVYLAREEDSLAEHDGVIEWVLDLHGTEYMVSKVSLFTNMVCHTSDCGAQFTLCSAPHEQETLNTTAESTPSGSCVRLVPGSNAVFQIAEFAGAKCLRLNARLWSKTATGASSAIAWQQSQLFRQKDTDSVLWPFEWKVELVREVPPSSSQKS